MPLAAAVANRASDHVDAAADMLASATVRPHDLSSKRAKAGPRRKCVRSDAASGAPGF
jgi:hypothetical protein